MKSQDVVMLAVLLARPAHAETVASLAARSGLSVSEAHGSLKRLEECRLMDGSTRQPWKSAAMEFLAHGLRYAFPARPGGIAFGLPTAHAAAPLKAVFAPGTPAWVWPWDAGTEKGESIHPLYASVPRVCAKDPLLWEWLALFDALRAGAARERGASLKELGFRLGIPVV